MVYVIQKENGCVEGCMFARKKKANEDTYSLTQGPSRDIRQLSWRLPGRNGQESVGCASNSMVSKTLL